MRHPVRKIPRARARHVPGVMNRTEEAYARDVLEPLRSAGEIDAWLFEPVKLRLGAKCFYSPDFLVIRAYGVVEFHEVKGTTRDRKTKRELARWEDDARAKIQVAASKYPWFRFAAVWKGRSGWAHEEIKAHHSEVT